MDADAIIAQFKHGRQARAASASDSIPAWRRDSAPQDDGGRFRELHEAHIARLAAENKLAEVQARLASTSVSAGQQVSKLEHAKESLQGDMSDARAKLAALEARFQQHLAECSGRQAAAAEKEASLELACRHARAEANIARSEAESNKASSGASTRERHGLEQELATAKACEAALSRQVKDLERMLSEADRERREVREKYVALGRRVDTLQGSEEALRYGIQEAVKDLESVMQQRDSLAASLAEAKRAGGRAAKYAHALHAEVEKLRQRSSGEAAERVDAKHTAASLQAQAKAEHERAERLAEELRRRRGNREDIRAQVEREAEASVKLQMQQRDFEWRQKYQELEVRLRQLASNDVVSNPSDYITKAEHARILDSRMASKDHDSSGELARRAADAERQLGIRLKAQAAELQEAHAEQLSRLQRKHETELAERAQQLQAQHEEVLQMKRAVKAAEEHAQGAKDAQQRLQGRVIALEEVKSELEDQREEAVRQVQHLQQELTHAQTHAAKHERDMLQEEFAELREALAGERKEASAAQAASAEELQSLKRQHKAAVQELEEKRTALEQHLKEAQEKASAAQLELQQGGQLGRAAAQEAEQSRQAVAREAEALKSQLRTAESSVEDLKKRIEHLEVALAEARQECSSSKEVLGREAAAAREAAQRAAQEQGQALAQHKQQAARLASQMAREVTQLRGQQMKLRAVCESEMQRAATDAASGIEGLQLRWRQVLEGLRAEASAADQAHTQAVAAARQGESQLWQERLQQAEAAAHQQVDKLQDQLRAAQGGIADLDGQVRQQQQRMEQLLSSLAATADISTPVLDAFSASEERPAAFPAAVQQLCSQVRAWAEDMAAKRVLVPLEQAMPDQALPTRRSSVRASFSIGASASRSGDADLDARVSRLVGTCRAAAARIQDLESALKQSEDAKEQTRRDGARAAADMHEEAVQPLKSEVSRMRQALVNLQGTYAQDVDQVRHAAEDQVNGARQEAQRAIRDLQTAAYRLQAHLGTEVQRADGLSQEVARLRASALSMPRDHKEGSSRASVGSEAARLGPAHAMSPRLPRSVAGQASMASPLTPTLAAAGFV
ncbi:g3352 [Coccomyxa viridis]|uniref:G3352 protein n=1 Tax=Coccomyxa viridis TaxID=1274662 RepID=A0ABP1FSQ3_9CHLO